MSSERDTLRGTTLKVYRLILKSGYPMGVRDVQRALNLSSPSVAAYHLSKLQEAGLIKQDGEGYVADKILLKNLVRFRRSLLPKSVFIVIFLASSLSLMLTIFRPEQYSSSYLFSAAVIVAILALSIIDTIRNLSQEAI